MPIGDKRLLRGDSTDVKYEKGVGGVDTQEESIKNILKIIGLSLICLLLSCINEEQKVKNLQINIVKNASLINRDIQSYLLTIDEDSLETAIFWKEENQEFSKLDIALLMIGAKQLNKTKGFYAFILSESGFFLAGNDDLIRILRLPQGSIVVPKNIENYNLLLHENKEISDIIVNILIGEKYFFASVNNNKYYVLCEEIPLLYSYLVYLVSE